MKVKFLPQDIEHEIAPNQSVLNLAQEKGIYIKSVCNGMPSCAECRVKVVEGDYNVLPPSTKELSLIGTGYFIDQRRLSCQLTCFGDVTVDLSEQVEKEKEDTGPRQHMGAAREDHMPNRQSRAVTGSLLEQDKDLVQSVAGPESQKSQAGGSSGGKKKRRRSRRPNRRS